MSDTTRTQCYTIGILYSGEMGSSLGRLLAEQGYRVVTTLEGRSPRTARLCREAGLDVLASLGEVVRASDIVISLVTPDAAINLAQQFCDSALLLDRHPLFVDANSISPITARRIAALVARARCRFVDASIYGLASRLKNHGTIYLSGPAARELSLLFSPMVKTRVLSEAHGTASAFKMIMAGLNKGLVALFLEMASAGRELGLLDELLHGYRDYYPGIMTVLDRLLGTYPQHATRRGQEMRELERTLESIGLVPNMARGARATISEIGDLRLTEHKIDPGTAEWSIPEVVEAIHRLRRLRGRFDDSVQVEGEAQKTSQALA